MKQALPTIYDPQATEHKWYQFWLQKGFFAPDISSTASPFCIVIPPPNVTGSLHVGHALNNTLQDILVRMRRMQGLNTLWVFGTDHAGIATQNVVEKQLANEGISRNDLGRDEFVRRVWRWKEESGNTIIGQLKSLGVSCDWSRERFTMDEGLSRAVQQVFIQLYREGLIYRGHYIINWCPRCHTALSDLEVEYHEVDGHLYYLKYPLAEGQDYIVVATTRPETMLGDTAVAVHPDDKRFSHLVGREVILPIVERRLPIIADSFVDPEFGTGSVKVTPAHDPNDFEIGLRHKLPQVVVMNPDATMRVSNPSESAGKYAGMDRFQCRHELLEELEAGGYIEKIEDHRHAVGHCYRCKTIIEPTVSEQWFLKMKPLAEGAIEAVRQGRVKLIPKQWENTYYEWMNNIRDWCISRQIWWGHRIPVWYCQGCNEVIPMVEQPNECDKCGSKELTPETDVLDTWFSSALWPFSTLGWPDWPEPELKSFYPTSVLVTGFDILFFWVARMIMMGLKFMGDVPFHEVYIHALVRDSEGQKMSKSKGNVIDPLKTMESYGTDAFRFTLTALAAQGRDICLSEKRIEGYRNFMNKIWNASRFVLMNLEGYKPVDWHELDFELADKWILYQLWETIAYVNNALKEYRFSDAASGLYAFFWRDFCDWYLELIKPRLANKDSITVQHVMLNVLEISLRLLHPIIPFITEEIWQNIPHKGESIMLRSYPDENVGIIWPLVKKKPYGKYARIIDVEKMKIIQQVIMSLRNLKAYLNIATSKKVPVHISYKEEYTKQLIEENKDYIAFLVRAEDISIQNSVPGNNFLLAETIGDLEVFIGLANIDLDAAIVRLNRELKKIEFELDRVVTKLSNKKFIQKAPSDVIEKQRQIHSECQLKIHNIRKHLKNFEGMKNS